MEAINTVLSNHVSKNKLSEIGKYLVTKKLKIQHTKIYDATKDVQREKILPINIYFFKKSIQTTLYKKKKTKKEKEQAQS